MKLWSPDGKPQGALTGHKDWISCAAFSPTDGNLLATGSYDHSVKLWDVANKKESAAVPGLKSSVWGVAFSTDGKLLAIGAHDSLHLWEVDGKKERFAKK